MNVQLNVEGVNWLLNGIPLGGYTLGSCLISARKSKQKAKDKKTSPVFLPYGLKPEMVPTNFGFHDGIE